MPRLAPSPISHEQTGLCVGFIRNERTEGKDVYSFTFSAAALCSINDLIATFFLGIMRDVSSPFL
jgi:hypothetical protein